MFAKFLRIYIWSYKLEPLSIISVIFQLANAAPEIDKMLMQDKKKIYSRTETIEIYRTNMNLSFKENTNLTKNN